MTSHRFPADSLTRAVSAVLGANGTPGDLADQVARSLVDSDLSGHASHGVSRVADYVRFSRQGRLVPDARPEIVRDDPTTVVIDGRSGYGHVGAALLTTTVADHALEHGICAGSLTAVAHIGRLGEWSELAADRGVLLFMATGWERGKSAAPFGGRDGALGTNPISFGAPGRTGPGMVLDMATTAAAEGRVRMYRDTGREIPDGWLIDAEGRPSTDPGVLAEGGSLLHAGGYKGYGLSLMAAVLGAALAGGPTASGHVGVFALALSPGLFGDDGQTLGVTDAILATMRSSRPAPGVDAVLVPGDVEVAARARAAGTVELSGSTWERFLATAGELGMEPASVAAMAQGAD